MQNLEFHQVRTSASKKVIITVSDLFPFMCHMLVRKQIIQQLILEEKKFSDESGKAIKGVLLCSRTLLSSIFCCLLLHNFSLFVSFIKFFTEILFVQIYPLTTWTASLFILPLSITLRRFTSSLTCHLARISYNVSTASNVHFALILQLISFVRWTYTSDFGPSS